MTRWPRNEKLRSKRFDAASAMSSMSVLFDATS